MATLSWASSPAAANVSVSTPAKYWNYAGSPVSVAVTTTPQTLVSAVTTKRAISYSASGSDGTVINIWINSDPATEPPTLKSYPGHNIFDWEISGSVAVATVSGTATIVFDTASEAPVA